MRNRPIRLTVLGVILGALIGALAFQHGYGLEAAVISLLGAAAVQLAQDIYITTERRFDRACRLVGIESRKEAAYRMGVDPSELTKALKGERKLDLWRLKLLGPEFVKAFAFLDLEDGLPAFAATAVKVAALVGGK